MSSPIVIVDEAIVKSRNVERMSIMMNVRKIFFLKISKIKKLIEVRSPQLILKHVICVPEATDERVSARLLLLFTVVSKRRFYCEQQ